MALLEAMQEHRVTIQHLSVDEPFYVCDPEPDRAEALSAAQRLGSFHVPHRHRAPAGERGVRRPDDHGDHRSAFPSDGQRPDLVSFQRLVRRVPVAEPVMRYALHPASGRPCAPPDLVKQLTCVRRCVALPRTWCRAKARALTSGRYHVSFDDIRAMAHPLRHRVLTNFRAESEAITTDQIIDQLLEMVPVPGKSRWGRR
jgi:MoxR-like ATPase